MIAKLLRKRRTRNLARAIARCDIPEVVELLDKGVDLDDFRGYQSDPIPHAMEMHYTAIPDVLEFAAMCHLPAPGFEALVRAGAPASEKAWSMAATYAQAKGAGPWKDAADAAEMISPAAFEQRSLQATTQPATAIQRGPRL